MDIGNKTHGLIQEYRNRKEVQATIPEGTPNWDHVDPISLVDMHLEGMSTYGMSDLDAVRQQAKTDIYYQEGTDKQ